MHTTTTQHTHEEHQAHHADPCMQCEGRHEETRVVSMPFAMKVIVTTSAFDLPSYAFSSNVQKRLESTHRYPPTPLVGIVILMT